jgi:hypothetical protein
MLQQSVRRGHARSLEQRMVGGWVLLKQRLPLAAMPWKQMRPRLNDPAELRKQPALGQLLGRR